MALSFELYLDLTEDSGSLQKALGVTCTHNKDFAKDLRPLEIHYYVVLVIYEIKIYKTEIIIRQSKQRKQSEKAKKRNADPCNLIEEWSSTSEEGNASQLPIIYW